MRHDKNIAQLYDGYSERVHCESPAWTDQAESYLLAREQLRGYGRPLVESVVSLRVLDMDTARYIVGRAAFDMTVWPDDSQEA